MNAARVTPQGHLYVQPEAAAKAAMAREAASGQSMSPPFQPTNEPTNSTGGRRALQVWGSDGRVRVRTTKFPYSAVGHLTVTKYNKRGSSCSGALIGPSTVFTVGKHKQAMAVFTLHKRAERYQGWYICGSHSYDRPAP
jgi:hypothetical protein